MDYLSISRTYGQIASKTTPAIIKIHRCMPRFKMKQKPPEMIVKRNPARVVIDQREAFADRGNKTIFLLMDEFVKWARDICAEGIAKASEEGSQISRAGKNMGNVIRQIILDRMINNNNISLNVKPAKGPDIYWEEGSLEIDWIIHQPEIEWEVNPNVEFEVKPGSVEIYVCKYPSLKIEVVKKDECSRILNRKI